MFTSEDLCTDRRSSSKWCGEWGDVCNPESKSAAAKCCGDMKCVCGILFKQGTCKCKQGSVFGWFITTFTCFFFPFSLASPSPCISLASLLAWRRSCGSKFKTSLWCHRWVRMWLALFLIRWRYWDCMMQTIFSLREYTIIIFALVIAVVTCTLVQWIIEPKYKYTIQLYYSLFYSDIR